jgi:inorganic pyrophosphatase
LFAIPDALSFELINIFSGEFKGPERHQEPCMQKTNYPQEAASFQIQTYRKPKDLRSLRAENVSFTGSPRKHPYDAERIILVADPYSTNTFYFEFEKGDIAFVEELPSVVDMEGNALTMVRIWVKKGSIAVRCTPFIAGDTRLAPD